MTHSHRTTKAHPAQPDKLPAEYESVRRETAAKYNSLLADARGRLRAVIRRVEQGRAKTDTDDSLELTQKIQELIDYLDRARL